MAFAIITVLIGGLWLGLMTGQDQWIKSAMRGSLAGPALSLPALTAAAVLVPAAFGENVYCSKLCAHGAAQQLLGNLRTRRFALPPGLHRMLIGIPWLTLALLWLLAFLGIGFPFADAEPFEVWSVGFIALVPVLIFVGGLLASVFLPQAYCHYGCPTGAVLKFLASSPGRWTRRDSIAGAVAVLTVISLKHREAPIRLGGRAMGCEWKLLAEGKWDRQAVHAEIAGVLEDWEQVLSIWRPDSDLSRYNRGEAASPDLQLVLKMAEALQQDSNGAFDHRLPALLTEFGFGPGGSDVDLSSLGKGIAVDAVCERLRQHGIHRHVFSLAGEVRAGEGEWPVMIEDPEPDGPAEGEVVTLSTQAMATSGNSRQWNRREGDKLASHILNPATGRPVLRPPCGVTVIGPDAAMASGWATALFVLGPEGNPLAEAHGYRVIWKGSSE